MPLTRRNPRYELSNERPLGQTHVGSGCPGQLTRTGRDDGYCARCRERLPHVFRRTLSQRVQAARAGLSDTERAVVNAHADHQDRAARETARAAG